VPRSERSDPHAGWLGVHFDWDRQPEENRIFPQLQSVLELERASIHDASARIESPDRTTENSGDQAEWLMAHDEMEMKSCARPQRSSSLNQRAAGA